MATKTGEIVIDKVKAVRKLELPILDGGGVVVLKGRRGCGKSWALKAVDALTNPASRKSLSPTDGADVGTISGPGITIRLGKSNTARGQLEVETLDSDCDLSALVDPGLKDIEAADKRRLETIIRLLKIAVSRERWNAMLKDVPKLLDDPVLKAIDCSDPVSASDKIRRRVHDIARETERVVNDKRAQATATRETVRGIDLEAPADEAELRSAVEAVQEQLTVARQQQRAKAEAQTAAEDAQRRLQQAQAAYGGPTAAECQTALGEATDAYNLADVEVKQAEDTLNAAKAKRCQFAASRTAADNSLVAAKHHESTLAEVRSILAASIPEAPDDALIAGLENGKKTAQEAVEYGVKVRGAKLAIEQADKLDEEWKQLSVESDRLRDIARSTDTVLQDALAASGVDCVRIIEGRVCVPSSRPLGYEPLGELSDGLRNEVAVKLGAAGVGKGGILTLSQQAWEGQDPDGELIIVETARTCGVTLYTAEATSGELRAEVANAGGDK